MNRLNRHVRIVGLGIASLLWLGFASLAQEAPPDMLQIEEATRPFHDPMLPPRDPLGPPRRGPRWGEEGPPFGPHTPPLNLEGEDWGRRLRDQMYELRKESPQLADTLEDLRRVQVEIERNSRLYHRETKKEKRDPVLRQLNELCQKEFDLEYKRQILEIERMEEKLNTLKNALAKKRQLRDRAIESKMKELIANPPADERHMPRGPRERNELFERFRRYREWNERDGDRSSPQPENEPSSDGNEDH